MRIGMCSTVSCGKTTLVKALAKLSQFKNYHTITERSKYLSDLGIPLNTHSTLLGQSIFLAERASELLQDNVITDRTIYDVMAYTLSSDEIIERDKNLFTIYASTLTKYYDLIIYISPEGMPLEDNGVRSTDEEYRLKVDKIIQDLLFSKFPPKNLLKVSGTTEERIEAILSHI